MAVPCLWRRTDDSTGCEIPNAIALTAEKSMSSGPYPKSKRAQSPSQQRRQAGDSDRERKNTVLEEAVPPPRWQTDTENDNRVTAPSLRRCCRVRRESAPVVAC